MIDHSLSVDEYRAPWTPKVGDRVRVLSRPECRYCIESPDEDGLTGTVRYFKEPREVGHDGAAHCVWVALDEIPESHGCELSHFAAVELEPLDEVERLLTGEPVAPPSGWRWLNGGAR